jgi:hypothetical protein
MPAYCCTESPCRTQDFRRASLGLRKNPALNIQLTLKWQGDDRPHGYLFTVKRRALPSLFFNLRARPKATIT